MTVIRLVNVTTLYLLFKGFDCQNAFLQICLTVSLKLWSFFSPASDPMTPQSELNDPQDGRLAGVDPDVLNSLWLEGLEALYFPIQSACVDAPGRYLPLPTLTRLTPDSLCVVKIISALIIWACCRSSLPASSNIHHLTLHKRFVHL